VISSRKKERSEQQRGSKATELNLHTSHTQFRKKRQRVKSRRKRTKKEKHRKKKKRKERQGCVEKPCFLQITKKKRGREMCERLLSVTTDDELETKKKRRRK